MNLQEMMDMYYEDGLTRELAAARVCQDIVLKAIAIGPLNRNVTVKGGVVMRSLTNNNRRATRDIDLDFIHYSIEDESIRAFIEKLNCIPEIKLEIVGSIEVQLVYQLDLLAGSSRRVGEIAHLSLKVVTY